MAPKLESIVSRRLRISEFPHSWKVNLKTGILRFFGDIVAADG
jgi:hypothetical protein